jgi:hypothetical protein
MSSPLADRAIAPAPGGQRPRPGGAQRPRPAVKRLGAVQVRLAPSHFPPMGPHVRTCGPKNALCRRANVAPRPAGPRSVFAAAHPSKRDGIAAVANSHVFTAHAHYVFGDLRTWGWVTLIIGVLQLLAAGVWRATSWPAGRRGGAGAQRDRPDVLHPRLPVLVPDDHRGGRGRAAWAVRFQRLYDALRSPQLRETHGGKSFSFSSLVSRTAPNAG